MRIKTVLYVILFLLALVGFFYLQSYDAVVNISLADYVISTRLIFLCLLLAIFFLLFNLLLRLALFPFNMISDLLSKFKVRQEKKPLQCLLQASQYCVTGQTTKAYNISRNILDSYQNLPKNIEECFRILFAKFDVGLNVKLHYMQKLLNSSSKFKFFAAKELSATALNEKAYHYSVEFASTAMEINNSDPELVVLMIKIYAAIEDWDKFSQIVNALKNLDKAKFATMKEEIAAYYLKAGKHFIGLGELETSAFHLKQCIEYNPNCLKCIELIVNIHSNSKDFDLKPLLEKSFALNPSFEIFLIYYKYFKNTLLAQEIYQNLVSYLDTKKHTGLIIAIAYFLNMKDELNKIVLPLI